MLIISTIHIRRDIRERLTGDYPEHEFRFHKSITEAEGDLSNAEVIITYGMDLEAKHIDIAERLKWLNVISAGVDQLPFEAIRGRDILVTNAKGIHAIQMAEYTIAMMLQVARETKTLIQNEAGRKWERKLPIRELYGHTAAILGTGAIGTEIARRTKAFGMRTIGFNRSGREADQFDRIYTIDHLKDQICGIDYLISVLPKTDETDGMLNKEVFNNIKSSAVLINIGRGNVIQETDLLTALQDGAFTHAVLDVFNEEPLPQDHPFWLEERITVTPHMSGLSPEYQPRAMDQFDINMKKWEQGETDFLNRVDPDKGY
ncbi:D-2-hydroxyacid dehydrogenase [Salisediminibacterium selenitireducens]|uniref:D-isomer specific 2-hydroxyacid dehydrogenase NAD-binding protein n=1 Tax=Bacillus selenitireducens (strain ATCC 700615 / DSM 15326 / MLS10) TaxID=439292 RepID=D6XYE6_BACIE|nr:D-2-hydroxyacid dehydrogenase [Salisediminibacterium selenitireducens]ADI00215.1 D-isomer specific 2-hydroxyacid dehydrogenase NAD-binding protein [[Bacillus] selenitireducens MLS10]